VPSKQSVAEKIAATIEFGEGMNNRRNGKWIIDKDPDKAGFTDYAPEMDILPNDLSRKLNIAFKLEQEEVCYIFATDSDEVYADLRDPRRSLPPGKHRVSVILKGINVNRVFVFDLENRGVNKEIMLTHVNAGKDEQAEVNR